jgi:ribosomal-protein-alanine N-acetyltransferase
MLDFKFILLNPSDVQDEWQKWFDSDHTQFYTRGGRRIALEELRNSIQHGLETGDSFTYGILEEAPQKIIGTVKLGPIDRTHGLADLAVLIGDKDYLGRGLASQLIYEASNLAFVKHSVRKLHSGILEHNVPSIKAYTRAGWIVEGILSKHYNNNGTWQDWLMISKFNPQIHPSDVPETHQISLESYFKSK